MQLNPPLRNLMLAILATIRAGALQQHRRPQTIEQQIQALRELVERQQAQLDEQQRQLTSQRAELDSLRVARTSTSID